MISVLKMAATVQDRKICPIAVVIRASPFQLETICIEYELSMTIRWFKVFGQVHSELFNRKEMENSGIKL